MPCARWEDLSREELNARAADAVAVLPVGSVEQHGPHLPTKTDVFIADAVTESACRNLPDNVSAVVLPPVSFGSAAHHLPFGGTLSLHQDTLVAVLMDLVRSVAACGFDRALMVNGHGGNVEVCGAVAKRAAVELDLLVAAVSYWSLLPPQDHVPGHAGWFETSMMLALAPESVHLSEASVSGKGLERLPTAGVVEDPRQWEQLGGWTDDPTAADPRVGREYFQQTSEALTQTVVALAGRQRPDATSAADRRDSASTATDS